MIDRTPWLVIKFGPGVPGNVMRLACLRCGDTNDTPLPIPVSKLTDIEAAFRGRHKDCKENDDAR